MERWHGQRDATPVRAGGWNRWRSSGDERQGGSADTRRRRKPPVKVRVKLEGSSQAQPEDGPSGEGLRAKACGRKLEGCQPGGSAARSNGKSRLVRSRAGSQRIGKRPEAA